MSTVSTDEKRIHVNDKGETGRCRRTTGACPFGEDTPHFDTHEEARAWYESSQAGSFAAVRIKRARGWAKRMVTVGGIALVGVSLAGCTTTVSPHWEDDPNYSPPSPSVSEAPEETLGDKALEAGDKALDTSRELTEKGQELVEKGVENIPSAEEAKDWASDKGSDVLGWLDDHDPSEFGFGGDLNNLFGSEESSSGSSEDTSFTSDGGVYFQGRDLRVSPEEVSQAQETLNSLVVKAEVDDGTYDRKELFGAFRTGVAGAVEHRDVPDADFRNDTPQARVVSGVFNDPYTGEPVQVIGGESYDADIDHIVPLKEVYVSQTVPLTTEQMKDYANDLDNLVYTASGVNRAKGDGDAGEWLPSYEPSQCIYVVKQIEIKGNLRLSVDSAEKAAMQQVINTRCVE